MDGTWVAAVTEDLKWARALLHRRSDLSVEASLKDWVQLAKDMDVHAWKLMLKHVAKGYLATRATLGPWERARLELNGLAAQTGLSDTLFSELGAQLGR